MAGTIPDTSVQGSVAPQPTLDVAVARPQVPDVGRSLGGMARDLEEASGVVAETNARQDGILAQAKANDLAGAVEDLRNGTQGFSSVHGGNAVGQQFLDGYQQRYADQLKAVRDTITSPDQLRLFDQHAQVAGLQFRAQLLAHQAQQTDAFNEQTETATVDLARKQVFDSAGEPAGTAAGIAQMEWAIGQRAARLGWSPEVTQATTQAYLGKVYDDAAALMTARDPNSVLGLIKQRLGAPAATGGVPGMTEPGNIDLMHRPHVKNADGSISTVRSLGVNVDGQEVLIPTVSEDGRIMSDQEAIAQYRATGKNLGKFSSAEASTAYAQQLHQQQEQLLSLPRGIRNNNPGNLEPPASGPWAGQTGTDGRFATFATPQDGIRAATRNLLAYQDTHGLNTIQGLVARWAPALDGNDVASYTQAIARDTGLPAGKPLDLRDSGVMVKLVTAMVQHENGQQPYAPDVIRQGVAAGLGLASLNPDTTPAAMAGPPAPGAAMLDLNDLHLARTGNTVIDGATVPQLLEWRRQAHLQAEQAQGGLRTGLEQRAKDFQAMVLAGVAPPNGSVPTPDEYAAAYGPNGPARYQNEVSDYQRVGEALGMLKGASYADRRGLVAALTPQPGPGFEGQQRVQQTLIKANELLEKQLAADPAAFARRAASVQATGNAMQAALGDQKSTPEQRAAAVDAYVQATTAEQQRLGVQNLGADVLGEAGKSRQPGVQLLTNGEANSLTDQFRANPANGAQIMDGLAAQWGKYFPQVFSQLARDDKLPPSALMIPNLATPFGKETLARLSDPKEAKAVMEALAPGDKKDLDTKLTSLNSGFYGSLHFQQGGEGTMSMVQGQQMLLAAQLVRSGKSVGDAARAAYQETVGHQYTFADTLRIPNAEQPTDVLRGADAVAKNPALLATQVPDTFRPGLTAQARADAWHDAMRSGPTWVANSDETGATLYVRGRTDSGLDAVFAVRGPDGKPLSYNWGQLRNIAAKLPPPLAAPPLGASGLRRGVDYGVDVGGAVARARAAAAAAAAGGG